MWELDCEEAEPWKTDTFKLWCWRRLLRVPWTARRSSQPMLKKINPEYSLEGLMLKLQYTGHLMRTTDSLEKDPDAGKDWRQEEKGTTEDEMVGWHHRLNRHEFKQAPGVDDGQGGLACCSPWGQKGSDTTERLNSNIEHRIRKRQTRTLLKRTEQPPGLTTCWAGRETRKM